MGFLGGIAGRFEKLSSIWPSFRPFSTSTWSAGFWPSWRIGYPASVWDTLPVAAASPGASIIDSAGFPSKIC